MKKLVWIIFVINFVLPIQTFADESISDSIAESISVTAFDKSDVQIKNLEAELDYCKESFDRVTNSYWASLGIIVGVICLLFGINFFNAKSNNEKQLKILTEQIKNEYEIKYNEALGKIKNSYSYKFEFLENQYKQDINYVQLEMLELKMKIEESKEKPYIPSQLRLSVQILEVLSKIYKDNSHYSDGQFIKQITFIINNCNKGIKFDHSDADDVRDMIANLPSRFSKEKIDLENAITYE